ncbi:MAG: FecR family protein [Flavobacteriaceae bacterium]|nr:FecR family protein [Flavobacteriaceae bacterium]
MNSKIEKAIIKFFDNEASLTELSSLLHWINNEKNYAQYVEYISINHLTNLALNKLDQEKIIEEINSRINSNKKPSIKKRALVFTNVAYVLCSLVIIIYLFSKGNLNGDLKSIDPNKITLTTENGNVIDLENLKENQSKINNNILVNQTNGTLYYKNDQIVETLTYNTINVPYGKVFNLELSDGTKVYLNSGTSLKYPVNFINNLDREVFLDGEAFFEVNSNKSQFIVSSNNTSAYVYGTKFNFKDYPEDNFSEVILTEGSLGVSEISDNIKNNDVLMIRPGERAKVNYSSGEIERSRVNTSLYTSWIDGRVAFRNESLPSMIQKLERIYNIIIINNNKDIEEKYFTATILYKEESINDVLSYLSEVYGLEYQIIDNKILIE